MSSVCVPLGVLAVEVLADLELFQSVAGTGGIHLLGVDAWSI